MTRRELIRLLVAAMTAWPIAALGQQPEKARRVGVLLNKGNDDPRAEADVGAFVRELQQHGWRIGTNLQIDYRASGGDADLYRRYAGELVALAPDVLLGVGGTVVGALQRATHDVPIVFVETTDPVNRGLVASLSRPGGNTTGFTQFEFAISGKWLALLKEIAPSLVRAAVIRDPAQFSGIGEIAAIQASAPALGVEVTAIDARDASVLESAIRDYSQQSNSGLIVTPSGASIKHRDLIVATAAQHRLPAIYAYRYFVTGGGLISYGPDETDQYRRAAAYVDRILKGEKPADLPVQTPNKYELVINLKAAKALGLAVSQTLQASADEVIE